MKTNLTNIKIIENLITNIQQVRQIMSIEENEEIDNNEAYNKLVYATIELNDIKEKMCIKLGLNDNKKTYDVTKEELNNFCKALGIDEDEDESELNFNWFDENDELIDLEL